MYLPHFVYPLELFSKMQIRSCHFFLLKLLSGLPWLSESEPYHGPGPPPPAPTLALCALDIWPLPDLEHAKPPLSRPLAAPSAWNHLLHSLSCWFNLIPDVASLLGPPQPLSLINLFILLPSHTLASLVACLSSVSSHWNGSFTSQRPGCLARCLRGSANMC